MSEYVTTPTKFAHIVLKARRYNAQIAFYQLLLGAHVVHQDDGATFMTYDDEHHRIAITHMPALLPRLKAMAGVDHYAFTYPDLKSLLEAYQRMKQAGFTPVWCTHHGATISIYYEDADTNVVETQVDVFETAQEVDEYLLTEDFIVNPLGVDFVPDELVRRLESGETWDELKYREPSGPRHPATLPRAYLGWFHWSLLQLVRRLGG